MASTPNSMPTQIQRLFELMRRVDFELQTRLIVGPRSILFPNHSVIVYLDLSLSEYIECFYNENSGASFGTLFLRDMSLTIIQRQSQQEINKSDLVVGALRRQRSLKKNCHHASCFVFRTP